MQTFKKPSLQGIDDPLRISTLERFLEEVKPGTYIYEINTWLTVPQSISELLVFRIGLYRDLHPFEAEIPSSSKFVIRCSNPLSDIVYTEFINDLVGPYKGVFLSRAAAYEYMEKRLRLFEESEEWKAEDQEERERIDMLRGRYF